MFKAIKNKISKNLFIFNEFIQSNTPIKVIYYFYRDKLKEKNLQLYAKDHDDFKKFISNLNFTTDWFTDKIPYWISIFNKLNIDRKTKLKCLEIGSFQGLSTIFILNYFKNATITCVDTWEGSKEHEKLGHLKISELESYFDRNTKSFGNRIQKVKGTSYSFYERIKDKDYDFIYVDGSHYCDDVMIDALKSFEILKPGGLLIFDDYIWISNEYPNEKAIGAINSFLRLKNGKYKIHNVYGQLVLSKNKNQVVKERDLDINFL